MNKMRMNSSRKLTKSQYQLMIVGHKSLPGPDKKGFQAMRIFSADKGVYSLKRWGGQGDWTIQKQMGKDKNTYSWLPIDDKQAKQLISGKQFRIDEDVIQVK